MMWKGEEHKEQRHLKSDGSPKTKTADAAAHDFTLFPAPASLNPLSFQTAPVPNSRHWCSLT